MSSPVLSRPSEVYDAIVATIVSALGDAGLGAEVSVGGYEDWGPNEAGEKQVLIEFSEMRPAGMQNDGRKAQRQQIVLYAVISKGIEDAARQALNLASDLARVADQSRWGLSHYVIDEPENITAQPSFLIERNNDHRGFEAWEVTFSQLLKYGRDQWDEDPGQDVPIALAINPVDADDDASYQELERNAEPSS